MDGRIKDLKAEIFDLIVKQENLWIEFKKLVFLCLLI